MPKFYYEQDEYYPFTIPRMGKDDIENRRFHDEVDVPQELIDRYQAAHDEFCAAHVALWAHIDGNK